MKNTVLSLTVILVMTGFAAFGQTVSGRVTAGSDGNALPGVSVLVKGTTVGTTTDADGRYSIQVTSQENPVLSFSFIGFVTQEIAVGGRTSIDVILEEDITQLGEVVVTSFGIPKETKSLGYATSTIQNKEITQTASPNFASALYGKAPGVRINTTPGGATSAVNITIRGVNSITNKTQPLIVLNGIPIRDGEVNNSNYWGDQRIRGNGLLDINPEDIESISILKGASAAALYGSDAVNGVVLITTKSGKGVKGFSVDFSTSYTQDRVAYLPRYQNVRGPGYPLNYTNGGQDPDGFFYHDLDGDGVKETRGILGATINFGPKFDGQPTLTWDGEMRPYVAQKNNYGGLFQTAHNKVYSLAVSHGSENSNIRLGFTRQDNEGVSRNAKNEKNIATLSSSFRLGKNYDVDVVVNYINQFTHNRPFMVDRLLNNFTGMMGRFEHADWYLAKYRTSRGYRYVTGSNQSLTPDENITLPGFKNDLMDYVWNVMAKTSDEKSDRVISSVTNTWRITNGLSLRGRVGTDLTALRIENRNPTEIPLIFGNSGGFSVESENYYQLYGDVMLRYNKQLSEDITMNVMAGYTGSRETGTRIYTSTEGGLSTENMFDLAASVNAPSVSTRRASLVKDAFIGTINAEYKGFLFLEATGRRDRTSTMHPSNNSFFYPSVNSSFVFSEAFEMPSFISAGKIRGSWGVVGNYPDMYLANIAYEQNNLPEQSANGSSVVYTRVPSRFGNDNIKPEQKYEVEFGADLRLFQNRARIDVSYYNAQIRDQILDLTLPATSGATSVLTNIGTLRNKGIEIAVGGVPIQTPGGFTWDAQLNLARNMNVVEKLASGSNELLHADYDGNAAQLKSVVGRPMGDIYAHPIIRDDNGRPIVFPEGLYRVDPDTMVAVGNAMPKLVGGLINTFSFKGISLTAVIDYRIGGHVMPTGLNWMNSRGLLEESLNGMDAEHGGLRYYEDANGNRFRTDAAQGPNGEVVYDNGIILDGVREDGEPNDYIVSNPEYYVFVYNWGGPQYNPNGRYDLFVKENSYVKMRELLISYQLPSHIAQKFGAKRVEVSVFGRNLFFFYRTIKDMDAEQTTAGSRWYQNVNNVGTNPSTRTFGASLRASF